MYLEVAQTLFTQIPLGQINHTYIKYGVSREGSHNHLVRGAMQVTCPNITLKVWESLNIGRAKLYLKISCTTLKGKVYMCVKEDFHRR